MSVRIDITGLTQERIHVVPSPLNELGMALHALSEPGHHPGLQGWATAVSTRLDPCLADRLCEADFLWRSTFSDVFAPFAGLPGRSALPAATLAEELDQLDKLTDEQFVDAALEFTCQSAYAEPDRNLLADPAVQQRALDLAAARGPHQVRFTRRLLDDPPAVRTWLRGLLQDCDEAFFADTWTRLSHQLAADARHKTELLRRKGIGEALRSISGAVSLDESGHRIVIDKITEGQTATGRGGLVLVPTSLGRPHLMVLHRKGWQASITYPVSAPGLAAPPTVEQLTRRMSALAHPVRMRLCRHLARGSYTTGELADAHGMTAPEISRHLTVLKKAGLVTTRRRGRYVQHQLDISVVSRLGSDFIEGVLR
ncbi:ArsR family transcriptional regulator OS=Streptomyces alboniger OX=132473 GN=CP975_19750 PE=4 SV=1 [Streptomyces alboniger]